MVLMDLTKAPNVNGCEKGLLMKCFSSPFSSKVFCLCLLFIFYPAQCFELGGRKGGPKNSELYENRIRG